MRRGWLSLGALLAVWGAGLAACDDASPVRRGFSSRQLLELRDPTFSFNYVGGDHVYYQTGAPLDLPPDVSPPPNYWFLDLATGQVTDLGMKTPDFAAIAAADGSATATGRYHCVFDQARTLTITDRQTGAVTTIEHPTFASPLCPADDDPTVRFWHAEADGTYSLWIGPYTAPQQITLSITVSHLYWPLAGGALVGAPAATAGGGIAVYQVMDADPPPVTEIVSAELDSAAWAADAASSAPLASTGLADQNLFLPAAAGHYAYERAMADGSTVMFVGPYTNGAAAHELALFPVTSDANLAYLQIEPYSYRTDGHRPVTTSWSTFDSGSPISTFRIWRDASARLATCSWAGQRVPVARADPPGENALFFNPASCCAFRPSSALLLMVPDASDGNPCRTLAPDYVGTADFSPDGSAMFWLVEDPSAKAVLWTAGRDGSGARPIGEGKIAGAFDLVRGGPHFVGDSQLELTLDTDLGWVDVHDDPIQMHYITERVFGVPVDLGRWLVTGHDFSDQDANGTLALINRDSGEAREISPAVTLFTTPDVRLLAVTPGVFQDDGRPVRVVYLVHGRNPSPQDGLWIATITAEDRQ